MMGIEWNASSGQLHLHNKQVSYLVRVSRIGSTTRSRLNTRPPAAAITGCRP